MDWGVVHGVSGQEGREGGEGWAGLVRSAGAGAWVAGLQVQA